MQFSVSRRALFDNYLVSKLNYDTKTFDKHFGRNPLLNYVVRIRNMQKPSYLLHVKRWVKCIKSFLKRTLKVRKGRDALGTPFYCCRVHMKFQPLQ